MSYAPSAILIDNAADWLMKQALADNELDVIVSGCCERLAAAGIPLKRVMLTFSVLHPLYRAMGFIWQRGEDLQAQGFRHVGEEEEDRFVKSPFYHLISKNLEHMRMRIDDQSKKTYPVFEEFYEDGITDYLGFRTEFVPGSGRGMLGSWTTDRETGFTDDEIAALLRIQSRLAVAAKMAVQVVLTENMLETYLGCDAGSRVLSGQIRRGDGETVRAAIVTGDIRGSTTLAEQLGRQAYINLLDEFFDNTADAFADFGGQILSFIGDGFLGVFPCERHRASSVEATSRAASGACEAVARMQLVNERRAKNGEPVIGYGLGLHVGNVMYGNVGLEDRLTFSVFGAAVNEAARLENLTKTYKVPIIASKDFVGYSEGEWKCLGTEKLRGVSEPMEIYTPKAAFCSAFQKPVREVSVGMSDAERVVMLHRKQDMPKAS